MKKLSIFLLFVVLAGSSISTATSLSLMANMKTQTLTVLDPTGTFDGSIGHRRQGNWTAIGAINGTYLLRNRFGRFNGEWSIHLQNQNDE